MKKILYNSYAVLLDLRFFCSRRFYSLYTNKIDLERIMEQERLVLAGQVLQGLLERDTGWTSKILDDVFYERLAKHTVKIVDAVLSELRKNN